jgi:hypothetical protein
MRSAALVLVLAASTAATTPLHAQSGEPLPRERGIAGGAILIATPRGEFSDYVGTGFGLGGHFILDLDPDGIIGLRADAGFINYGRETRRVCFSQTVGCRIQVDLTTNNNIFYGNFGPELTLPAGIITPYFNAGIGFAYFATTSTVEDVGPGARISPARRISTTSPSHGSRAVGSAFD